jgi:hypothetical protein
MLNGMKRTILGTFLVLSTFAFEDVSAALHYEWYVSGSPTDPCATRGNLAVGGLGSLFLWYLRNTDDGMSAADLSVVVHPPGAVNVLAFNTANGFLNAGNVSHLLLAVGGCPYSPLVAGSWLVLPVIPDWELCLGGERLTVDCQINPTAWDSGTHGYANGGAPHTCINDIFDDCYPLAVEPSSWGKVKTLYR